jgi:hypothetical protein
MSLFLQTIQTKKNFHLKHLQKPVESTAEKIIFNIDRLIQVRNNFNYRIRLYLLAKLILSAHARDYKVQLLERMLNWSCWQQDDVLIRVCHCPSLSQTFGGTGPTATLMFRISFHTYFVSLKALLFLFFVPELQCLGLMIYYYYYYYYWTNRHASNHFDFIALTLALRTKRGFPKIFASMLCWSKSNLM